MRKEIQLLLGACALLLFLEVVPLFLSPALTGNEAKTSALHISDLEGQPSLGEAAVMVAQEGDDIREMPLCQSLPERGFALLLLVYASLLAFNLRESSKAQGQPGGVFEIILTGAFLILWISFDECRTATWFPLLLLKTGLILYILAGLTWLSPLFEKDKEVLY